MSNIFSSTNICKNILCKILEFLHNTETCLLSKEFAEKSRRLQTEAAVRLQEWYKSHSLVGSNEPYEYCTLRTLKRFYVTKYSKSWLRQLTKFGVKKLGLTGDNVGKYLNPTAKMKQGVVRTFYQFCDEFNINANDLYYYGW